MSLNTPRQPQDNNIEQSPDNLHIQFLLNEFFCDAASGNFIDQYTVITGKIPKQLVNDGATAMLVSSAGPATSTMTSMMYGNLAINLVMSASLQMLWGMINVMQLIVHMPLLNIQFPQNAAMLYGFLNNMASFNLIPTDQLNSAIFKFDQRSQPSNAFQNMGYNSDTMISNLGSMFVYLIGYIFLVILALILKKLKNKHKLLFIAYSYLTNMLFFNMILRTFLEGYIEFAIDAMINLGDLTWNNASDYFASTCAIIITMIVFSLPILVWVLLWRRSNSLDKEVDKKRFGAAYEEIRIDSKSALLYNVFYMLRRLVFAAVTLYLENYPVIQVQAIVVHCLIVLSYIMYVRPFELPMMNSLEAFNEGCILAAAIHMFLFTDYTPDPTFQYTVGWSIVGVTLFNIAVNMLVMIWASIRKVRLQYMRFKLKFEQWKNKQAKKGPITENSTVATKNATNVDRGILKLQDIEKQLKSSRSTVKSNRKKGGNYSSKRLREAAAIISGLPKRTKRVSTLDELRRKYNKGINDFQDDTGFHSYQVERHAALMQLQKDHNFKGWRDDGTPCSYQVEEDQRKYIDKLDHDMVVQIGATSTTHSLRGIDELNSRRNSFNDQVTRPLSRPNQNIQADNNPIKQYRPISFDGLNNIDVKVTTEIESPRTVKRDVSRILQWMGVNQDGTPIEQSQNYLFSNQQSSSIMSRKPSYFEQTEGKEYEEEPENIYISEKRVMKGGNQQNSDLRRSPWRNKGA